MTLPKRDVFAVSNLFSSDGSGHIKRGNEIRNYTEKKNNGRKLKFNTSNKIRAHLPGKLSGLLV